MNFSCVGLYIIVLILNYVILEFSAIVGRDFAFHHADLSVCKLLCGDLCEQ